MTQRSERLRGLVLLYLVLLGSVPFLDGLTYPQSPEGFHPRHNVQLGWKLMHIVPALAGIGVAASLLKSSPLKGFPALVILTMQVVLAVAEYRRVGFNPLVPREFTTADYLVPAGALAVPFLIISIFGWLKGRAEMRR